MNFPRRKWPRSTSQVLSSFIDALPRAFAATLLMSLAATASADLQFEFDFTDQGVGFNDPVEGAARRQALAETAQLTAAFFPSLTGTIRLRVDGSVTEDSTLASAGSFGPRGCGAGFDNAGDVLIIALGGADPDGSNPDGQISVNFEDVVWDLDDDIAFNAFDFKSTLIHELIHALGFSGTLGRDPVDGCGSAAPNAGSFDPFDKHLGDNSGPIIDNGTAVIDAARWNAAVVGGTGTSGLLWQGPRGKAANDGQPIPLFSPTEFSGGSSIAHLDDDFYTSQALLMEAATGEGPGIRTLSAIERGILEDIGYPQSGSGSGSGLSAINLNSLVFDNLSITPGGGTDVSVTGTSGLAGSAVAWSVPLAFGPLTNVTGVVSYNFQGLITSGAYEHIHIGGFTLNFDSPISSLLIFAQNDNSDAAAGFDLGITPVDFGGATTQVGATGFRVGSGNLASYFLYEFATPTHSVVASTLSDDDGFDISFFPNVLPPSPTSLPLNGQTAATLNAAATDSFQISVTEAGTLTISSSGSLDLVGTLLQGEQTLASDDDGGDNTNFSITQLISAPGDYLLQVRGFDETVSGAYTLNSSFTPSASDNCPEIIDDDGNLWNSTIRTCSGTIIAADEAQLFRSYSGAFNRTPDTGGYNWWLNEIRQGRHTLSSMLAGFLFSEEFLGLVNAPDGNSIDNTVFVNHVYQNVFERLPDPGGFNFWFGELESGRRTQARVLEEMTQSNEFVEKKLEDTVQFIAP